MEGLVQALEGIAVLIMFTVFIWGSVEGAIEYFVSPLFDWSSATPEERRQIILREVTLLIGQGVAFLLGLDLVTVLAVEAGADPISPVVGTVLTGIFMARGSNWLHDRFANPLGFLQLEPAEVEGTVENVTRNHLEAGE